MENNAYTSQLESRNMNEIEMINTECQDDNDDDTALPTDEEMVLELQSMQDKD